MRQKRADAHGIYGTAAGTVLLPLAFLGVVGSKDSPTWDRILRPIAYVTYVGVNNQYLDDCARPCNRSVLNKFIVLFVVVRNTTKFLSVYLFFLILFTLNVVSPCGFGVVSLLSVLALVVNMLSLVNINPRVTCDWL